MIEGIATDSGWLWLAFLVALLHPILVSTIGALPFVSPLLDDHRYFLNFWGTTVIAAWAATFAIAGCLRLSGVGVRAIGILPPQPRILLILVVIALGLAVAIKLMPPHAAMDKQQTFPSLPWSHRERWFMLLVVAPTAAICEETIYRGLLLRFMTTLIGLWPAMIGQALLFAYMHGGIRQPRFLLINGSIIGFLLALLVNWRGNLRAAMSIHFLIDAVQLSMIPS